MLSYTIQVDDSQLQKRLNIIIDGLSNFSPLFKKISPKSLALIDDQFKTVGKAFGTPWAALRPSTVIQKMKMGMNNGILQRTGAMRKSFVVKKLNSTELIIGSSLEKEYMKYHQLGTRKMVARPLLKTSAPQHLEKIRMVVSSFLKNLVHG